MGVGPRPVVQLGELVVTAFDVAAGHCTDPRDIPRLATAAVADMLRRRHEPPGVDARVGVAHARSIVKARARAQPGRAAARSRFAQPPGSVANHE